MIYKNIIKIVIQIYVQSISILFFE